MHGTLLKLSLDVFSLTSGQSPKELIALYEREQNVNVIHFDHGQRMAKKSSDLVKRFAASRNK